MKNDRAGFMSSNAAFFPQGIMPTNQMMFPNYMNDNYSNLEGRVSTLEKKMKNIENRVSRLEGNYPIGNQNNQSYQTNSNNYPYQSTQNGENYNGEMYMM